MTILDITLTNGWAIAIGIGIAIILWHLFSTNSDLQKQKEEYLKKAVEIEKQIVIENNQSENKLKEQLLTFQNKEAELKVTYQKWAIDEFDKFKKIETDKIQLEAEKQALKGATVLLQKWKIENESKIRQDAINRSYSVNMGKITEHLIPFHESFLSQFNPKDARFIGSPIDLIVFDGYADKNDEIFIYLAEIKTGNSKLTDIQKKVKAAVLDGRVRWAEINPSNYSSTKMLNSGTRQPNNFKSYLDFDNNGIPNFSSIIDPLNNESKEDLIDRVIKAIDGVGLLMEIDGYTLQAAILKQIDDYDITFKAKEGKEIFTNYVEEKYQ